MALKVDPTKLAGLAGRLDEAGEQAQAAVSTAEEVAFIRPPGGDPISNAAAVRLTKQAAQLVNLASLQHFYIRRAAWAMGQGAKEYADADIDGRIKIDRGSAEGDRVPNPVEFPTRMPPLLETEKPTDVPKADDVIIDHLEFAVLLEQGGDKGASAKALSEFMEAYERGVHQLIGETLVETTKGVQDWESVGRETVAPLFEELGTWHNDFGRLVITVAQRAENLLRAFQTVSAFDTRGHPSKETILAAKNAVTAPGLSPTERAAKARELDEIEQKAERAREEYFGAIVQGVPDTDFDRPPPDIANPTFTAVDKEIPPPPPSPRVASGPETNGTGPATNGAEPGTSGANTTTAEESDSSQTGAENGEGTNNGENTSTDDLRSALSSLENALDNNEAADPGAGQAQSTGANQNQAGDPNAAQLAQPANSLNPQNQGQNAGLNDGLGFDDPLEDLPPLDYETGLGGGYVGGGTGGGASLGGVRGPDTRTAALSATTNSSAPPGLASAEKKFGSLPLRGGLDSGFGRGMGSMPFMPMGGMPGLGNQNGNGSPTKFTPDAPVVADDKLPKGLEHHTVNEKPPVVPDATKETLLTAGRKSDTNQGGTPA